MSSDIAIKVDSVSKCFHVYDTPRDRLKQFLLPRLHASLGRPAKQYFREFWALRDISFDIKKGETVGIIGRNGSGKSTLLQIICGTLSPTNGSAYCKGRVGALLELGSGFNPDFTGRENIYMNASILGIPKDEIDYRFEQIVEFSGIGDFVEQPVRVYSSGMMVRLAFAVQAQIDPDVLIVDEALAVGDAKFQAKCFDRLAQLKQQGTSILLVTHASDQIVNHCDRAVLLDAGIQKEVGEPRTVINHYLDLLFGKSRSQTDESPSSGESDVKKLKSTVRELGLNLDVTNDVFATRPGYNEHEYRWGDGQARILDFCLLQEGVQYPTALVSGAKVEIAVAVEFRSNLIRPILGLTIKTKEGIVVYGANTETLDVEAFTRLGHKGDVAVVRVSFNCLLSAGDYFLSLGIATGNGEGVIPHDRRYDAVHLHVMPDNRFFGLADLSMTIEVEDPLQ